MSTIAESHLSNKDLAPTGPEQRTWGTYTLAAGLIAAGMTWWQGLLTVALEKYGVFVAFALSAVSYVALMRAAERPATSPAAAVE